MKKYTYETDILNFYDKRVFANERLSGRAMDGWELMSVVSVAPWNLAYTFRHEVEEEIKPMPADYEYIENADIKLAVLKTRVIDLPLSVRSMNILKGNDIDTVYDILHLGKRGIYNLRNTGKKTLMDIENMLKFKNLSFDIDAEVYLRNIQLSLEQQKETNNE